MRGAGLAKEDPEAGRVRRPVLGQPDVIVGGTMREYQVRIHAHAHARTRTHTHTHARAHARARTHTHTNTHTNIHYLFPFLHSPSMRE